MYQHARFRPVRTVAAPHCRGRPSRRRRTAFVEPPLVDISQRKTEPVEIANLLGADATRRAL